jgi:mannose-1-phosphate guanylyltransferase
MIKAVVMAGGSGARHWLLSRAGHPKQFLALNGKDTMLQATMKRLNGLNVESSLTICNEEHRFFVAEQLREIDRLDSIILEPVGRNTAPAIALAAFMADGDPLLLVLAADHVIQDEAKFTRAVTEAIPLAEAGKLVTFGIVPSEPHTGYGYVKKGIEDGVGFVVDKFVEKPSSDLAQEYLKSGDYFWNSGMFLFRASRYLEELQKFRPDIFEICKASTDGVEVDLDFLRVSKEKFVECPSDSIDYAVMEKTAGAVVVPMDAGWSDIGSWS